jgi:hypothetical protein
MEIKHLSGAALAKPFDRLGIDLYQRKHGELGQFLCAWPGGKNPEDYDTPLPNIAMFDRLEKLVTPQQLESLAYWVEPQTTVEWLLRVHGIAGCKRVLRGIAKACVSMQVPMKKRVLHTAQAMGLTE